MEKNNHSRREDGNSQRPRRTFRNDDSQEKHPYHKPYGDDSPRHAFHKDGEDRPKRTFHKDGEDRPKRTFHKDGEDRPKRTFHKDGEDRPKRTFHKDGEDRPKRTFHKDGEDRPRRTFHKDGEDRPKRINKKNDAPTPRKKKNGEIPETARPNPANNGLTRLNKYIADAGICSRREADKLIAAGAVSVNGQVITEMGFKVKPGDVVSYGGETLKDERKRYFLLNKPKGFITTNDDPQDRHTVMELMSDACKERIYPVGRLDRNTTGLLLFTNDGDLSLKLTHPSTGIYKIYHVELNRPISSEDIKHMRDGIELDDGLIKVDDVQYAGDGIDKRIVGVALHSGRNRIVRRIFESMGYEVNKLDRVVFAGLTKKDLPRGRYRELTEKEVSFLKMI